MTRNSSRARQPLSRVNLTAFAMPTSGQNRKYLSIKKSLKKYLKLALPKFLLRPKKSELPTDFCFCFWGVGAAVPSRFPGP